MFEAAVEKFINSPAIRIAYSEYLFGTVKSTHSALIELSLAKNMKPSLSEQFRIFVYSEFIIKAVAKTSKDGLYSPLTSVIQYEELEGQCRKEMEKVSQLQIDFWNHINTSVPDLNVLHDTGTAINETNREVDRCWESLCAINADNPKAMLLYGNYMVELRKNLQKGEELIAK